MSTQMIPHSSIRTEGMQIRTATNRAHVDGLIELFGDNEEWPAALPPLTVFYDGEHCWLADGHHRYQAAQEAGCTSVPCDVHPGSRDDAKLHACGANASHGLPRTPADKRTAVLTAYEHDPRFSDNCIAKLCKVSQPFVSDLLRSEREHRRGTYNVISGDPAPDVRIGADGVARNVSRIGRKPSATISKDSDAAWLAPGQTVESTATPWDGPPSQAAPLATSAEPTRLAPMAELVSVPSSDVRVDANGRRGTYNVISGDPAPEVAEEGEEGSTPGAPSSSGGKCDALGVPLTTDAQREAFSPEAIRADREIQSHLRAAQRIIGKYGKTKAGLLYQNKHLKCVKSSGADDVRFICADVKNALAELDHYRPYSSLCPYCNHKGNANDRMCNVCMGLPYVSKAAFEAAPSEMRQAILDKREGK